MHELQAVAHTLPLENTRRSPISSWSEELKDSSRQVLELSMAAECKYKESLCWRQWHPGVRHGQEAWEERERDKGMGGLTMVGRRRSFANRITSSARQSMASCGTRGR
jgi:hypothetical protein